MGFNITTRINSDGGTQMAKMLAGEDLYQDDSGKLVAAGPEARVLVAREGRPIPIKFEDEIGKTGKIKKARKTPSDKSRKPGGDK